MSKTFVDVHIDEWNHFVKKTFFGPTSKEAPGGYLAIFDQIRIDFRQIKLFWVTGLFESKSFVTKNIHLGQLNNDSFKKTFVGQIKGTSLGRNWVPLRKSLTSFFIKLQ